jgi:hypothetical protein
MRYSALCDTVTDISYSRTGKLYGWIHDTLTQICDRHLYPDLLPPIFIDMMHAAGMDQVQLDPAQAGGPHDRGFYNGIP